MKRASISDEEDGELIDQQEEERVGKKARYTRIEWAGGQDEGASTATPHDDDGTLPDEEHEGKEDADYISTNRWDSGGSQDGAPVETENKSRWLDDASDDDELADDEPSPHLRSEGADHLTSAAASEAGGVVEGTTAPNGIASPQDLKQFNMKAEARRKDDFDFLQMVGKGTYGAVSKATDKKTNEIKALKNIIMPDSHKQEGFPMTSVREINILLGIHHENVVDVSEVVTSDRSEVFMVMEYVQQDLKMFLEKYNNKLKIGEIKRITLQLLSALAYLHENWVLHRDLKPANILYDHLGNVKVCDFGLSRQFGSPIHPMSPLVVTRYYRGPEIAMGVNTYGPPLDVWSIGIITAELLTGKTPFVDSHCDLDLAPAIAKIIGSPHDAWKDFDKLPNANKINITKGLESTLKQKLGVSDMQSGHTHLDTSISEVGYDLIERMLRWDPAERITAAEAVKHEWFQELVPPVSDAVFMPQLHLSSKHR